MKLSNKGWQLSISMGKHQRSPISNWRRAQAVEGKDLSLHCDRRAFAVKDRELQDERGRDWDV